MNLKIETSWDDGCSYDFRMIKLLDKYNLSGIFYIPTNTELTEIEIKQISNSKDIGGHTTTHPEDMKILSPIDQENEIISNKLFLENIIGKEILSFCYPGGKHNEVTADIVKKCGFKDARTTNIGCTEMPKNIFRKETTVHVNPFRKEYNGINWLDYAKQKYTIAKENNGYYHIWGHSWEVDKYNLWRELEQLFNFITKNV